MVSNHKTPLCCSYACVKYDLNRRRQSAIANLKCAHKNFLSIFFDLLFSEDVGGDICLFIRDSVLISVTFVNALTLNKHPIQN